MSRIYEVSSTAVYKWIRRYSQYAGQHERVVVRKESEQAKTMWLLKKIAELEQLVEQKQLEVEYLKKVIEFGSEVTETDIKKSSNSGPELVPGVPGRNRHENGNALLCG